MGQQADARLAEYRQQGYTVFEGVYDEGQMQLWREECLRLEASSPGIYAPGNRSWWFGNMLAGATSFFIYYNSSWFKQTDTMGGSVHQSLGRSTDTETDQDPAISCMNNTLSSDSWRYQREGNVRRSYGRGIF